LERPPTDAQIEDWNRRFRDITTSGRIRRTDLPAEDLEDPLLVQLHGVSLRFDRRKTVRLRQLIDCINGQVGD
jgi:hypothetical protein